MSNEHRIDISCGQWIKQCYLKAWSIDGWWDHQWWQPFQMNAFVPLNSMHGMATKYSTLQMCSQTVIYHVVCEPLNDTENQIVHLCNIWSDKKKSVWFVSKLLKLFPIFSFSFMVSIYRFICNKWNTVKVRNVITFFFEKWANSSPMDNFYWTWLDYRQTQTLCTVFAVHLNGFARKTNIKSIHNKPIGYLICLQPHKMGMQGMLIRTIRTIQTISHFD